MIAWEIRGQNDNILVKNTFKQAIAQNPIFQNQRKEQGMIQSISRVACCWDNGPTGGLWGIIKTEMYKMYEIYDKESLIEAIRNYINFYNYQRYQERYNQKHQWK